MTTFTATSEALETLGDLLKQLGDIPPERVRLKPAPGTATERDVIDIHRREKRLCELVDGVLVEKAMGFKESIIAGAILAALRAFVVPRNLGVVAGADGTIRLFPGLVRIPDVAFASWQRLPDGRVPDEPIPSVVPELAVEVVSKSNTPAEMSPSAASTSRPACGSSGWSNLKIARSPCSPALISRTCCARARR